MGSAISALRPPVVSMQALQGGVREGMSTATSGEWQGIVSRVTQYAQRAAQHHQSPRVQIQHISDLLRVQADVSRYQLRVELVSKVSESAVASLRKLQQNQ